VSDGGDHHLAVLLDRLHQVPMVVHVPLRAQINFPELNGMQ
jgi:hypothetical protein